MIWAVSLSTTKLIPRRLTATLHPPGIRSLADVSNPVRPISQPVALPPEGTTQRCTYMHFGENQLSRSLIGLSPLPTAHPPGLQPWWVRASTTSYRRFNLAMDRSLRFGSRSCHSNALFRLAFATDTPHGLTSRHNTNSQAHSSKGTLSPQKAPTACKHTVSGTISLPSRGTFHHSLTVLIHYRSLRSI